MENDTIRTSGSKTLVDLWVDGKMRGICVTRGAIEAHLGLSPDQAAGLSDEERSEFVRTHLALIMSAARDRLQETGTSATTILIDTGQLGGANQAGGDRRKTERRKTDRRKSDRSEGIPATGDRRRVQRRKADRRGRPKTAG